MSEWEGNELAAYEEWEGLRPPEKIYVVGRHKSDFGGQAHRYQIVGQEDVTWPLGAVECIEALEEVAERAREAEAKSLVLQNTPGQVAIALAVMAQDAGGDGPELPMSIGVVISVPDERPAGVQKSVVCTDGHYFCNAAQVAEMIRFANPRARIAVDEATATVTATVDPPMRFKFSHIEWLGG